MDYDEIAGRLGSLRSSLDAKMFEYSRVLKEAAASNWDPEKERAARSVLREAETLHAEFQQLVDKAEGQMRREGFEVPADSQDRLDPESRWWRKDLTPSEIAPTGDIEDALDVGLEKLIARVPIAQWKEEEALYRARQPGCLLRPLVLYGGIPFGRQPDDVSRYVYALLLSRDFMEKRDTYEPFAGAFLVSSIAALATRLDEIGEVKGGFRKLDELVAAPDEEIDPRIYELLVAGRATSMGREIEFLFPVAEKAPDMRIHGLPFPAVAECKMQSRLSREDRTEIDIMQQVFREVLNASRSGGLVGTLNLAFSVSVSSVPTTEIVAPILECLGSLNPYREITCPWGTLVFSHLDPSIQLRRGTPLFSPYFLAQVFGWAAPLGDFDGICATVANRKAATAGRAELPFCLRWRTDFGLSIERKARHVVGLLKEAVDQIPVGEGGFLYLAYEDTHRAVVADLRTQRIRESMADFYITKRGVVPVRIVINRLHPQAIGDGRPDLIESCMPIAEEPDDPWHDSMPTQVYVPSPDESVAEE